MMKRRRIPREVEAEVLVRSRRRCCICAYLQGDFREKQGQLAHLDRNPANVNPDNFIFLCLNHHDQYDTSTSQSKGLTTSEVVRYRTKLYRWSAVLDRAERGITTAGASSPLHIPWAFEIHYPHFELLFRVSPRIYGLLPHHTAADAELEGAIEDPVHAIKGCYQLLDDQEPRREWESEIDYRSRRALLIPTECNCGKQVLNVPPLRKLFHDPRIAGLGRFAVHIVRLKRRVFSEIRHLISLQVPLAGRVPVRKGVLVTAIRFEPKL